MPLTNRFFLADFVSIQRNSFLQFLEKGLIEEISKRNPIINASNTLEVFFYAEYYQLSEPKKSPRQAILEGKSYASRLYVPVQLTDKKLRIIKLKWVYLSDLPIMTKRGHFIINGAARVIVNQIIRSPGIYYQTKLYENFPNKWSQKSDTSFERHYADIICQRGTWLRLEVDKDKKIWAQTKKGPKIPIMWLLIAMGLTEKRIFQSVLDPNRLLYTMYDLAGGLEANSGKKLPDYILTPPEAWAKIYSLFASRLIGNQTLAPKQGLSKQKQKELKANTKSELGRQLVFNKFMNPRTYDLSKHGRLNLNKKLNLSISSNQTTLTPQDILAATNHLLKVENGFHKVDDIDNLKNRRVRTSGELIQIQFGTGLIRLEKSIKEKMPSYGLVSRGTSRGSKTASYGLTINNLIPNTKPVNSALREFFGTSPLSQFMDQINPLAELTHKRRLSSMGPGGVTRDSATLDIRGIHPSHYGRICPVETPEGKNTGLVNSLTTYARVNSNGYIETPFYRVYKGQVQKKTGMYFFSADKEQKIKLGAADLFASEIGFLSKSNIPVRIEEDFSKISREVVEFVGVSPTQMVSIATSLIPFLEHDDANRALMGSNMQRQAVPIFKPERPIVGTGLEGRVVSDSGHALQTAITGVVTYVSSEKITIYRPIT